MATSKRKKPHITLHSSVRSEIHKPTELYNYKIIFRILRGLQEFSRGKQMLVFASRENTNFLVVN